MGLLMQHGRFFSRKTNSCMPPSAGPPDVLVNLHPAIHCVYRGMEALGAKQSVVRSLSTPHQRQASGLGRENAQASSNSTVFCAPSRSML
jgi:hypothetical protein